MKIVCNIYVGYRSLPNKLAARGRKYVKSTLALCKHPKSGEFCMILFTSQNQNGTKYAIKDNIKQVLTKFVNEGKCTVQFVSPEHDLFIDSDPVQLKAFLHLLRRALENKISNKELTTSSIGVTGVKLKDMPSKTLSIQKRSDYPSKGFPRTLEELHINGIDRCGVDIGIFNLVRLKVLDLSNNLIETIPKELNTLPNLREFNISCNLLFKEKSWNWLGGNLSKSLQILNLSHNKLEYVPRQISHLSQLDTLNLNNNCLKKLIPGIGKLRNLKIFNASNNELSTLPGNVKSLSLKSIDLSHNNFQQNIPTRSVSSSEPLPVCTLKEYAGRKVLGARIPYPPGTLPWTVIAYLDSANFCMCGRACLDRFIKTAHNLMLTSIAESVSTSVGEKMYVPVDSYFCSVKCYTSAFRARTRNPIIR
ncbi:unnamed protein product [Diabrotica balteata]|uniref:PIF1/LRR1 pleckstrin homology domain-containing protein n=1 Tax=Diabrotica balteata TaxID=107213 RepID=A0A9N9SWQ6_DIABA|nr:unnamed protein product [Diabrotica balteata]